MKKLVDSNEEVTENMQNVGETIKYIADNLYRIKIFNNNLSINLLTDF